MGWCHRLLVGEYGVAEFVCLGLKQSGDCGLFRVWLLSNAESCSAGGAAMTEVYTPPLHSQPQPSPPSLPLSKRTLLNSMQAD